MMHYMEFPLKYSRAKVESYETNRFGPQLMIIPPGMSA